MGAWIRGLVGTGVVAVTLVVAGCGSEDEAAPNAEDGTDGTSADELASAPLGNMDMVPVDAPAGFPDVWEQPDSTGAFNQKGKCGPAAVANALRMYNIEVSPQQADEGGVHFVVGSLASNFHDYFRKFHPQLGCQVDHPVFNATKYLRDKIDDGRPVMVWFNTAGGFLQSHWVVAVAHHGAGADEKVVVMSWGRYYEISMEKLEHAWRWVLGLPHPAVVCDATSAFMSR